MRKPRKSYTPAEKVAYPPTPSDRPAESLTMVIFKDTQTRQS